MWKKCFIGYLVIIEGTYTSLVGFNIISLVYKSKKKMVKIGLRSLTESEFLSLLKHQNENISVKGGYRDIDIFKSQRRIRSGGSIFSFLELW